MVLENSRAGLPFGHKWFFKKKYGDFEERLLVAVFWWFGIIIKTFETIAFSFPREIDTFDQICGDHFILEKHGEHCFFYLQNN